MKKDFHEESFYDVKDFSMKPADLSLYDKYKTQLNKPFFKVRNVPIDDMIINAPTGTMIPGKFVSDAAAEVINVFPLEKLQNYFYNMGLVKGIVDKGIFIQRTVKPCPLGRGYKVQTATAVMGLVLRF